MTKLLTNNYKLNLAKQLEESLSEPANNSYYIYTAFHVPREGNTIPTPNDNIQTVLVDQYRNMIFGKRITDNDVSLMIANKPYESNKVYTMYDDDVDIFEDDFYCIVDEGSFSHVYKCLDNNLGANSTVEPQFAFVSGSNNYTFRTVSDGYLWKYMYSIDDTSVDYFGTQNYFPVTSNTIVEEDAIKGAIDVIAIDGEGKGYNNYTSGAFVAGDIKVTGNTLLYKISNNSISHTNGFYTGCILYISTGPGAGQYKTIVDYFSNGNGNFVVIQSAFATNPENGNQYQVNPQIKITGSGSDLVNACARGLVNSLSSNSLYRVEMLNIGTNYDYAVANVIANTVVGVIQNAIVRPIHSPLGGHGANSFAELGAKTIVFTTKFQNTESNTILISNEYQTIGLIKDPKFANVNIELANSSGTFLANEEFYALYPIRVASGVTVNTTSPLLTCESLRLTNTAIIQGGTTGSYIPGDILTINGLTGTPIVNAEVIVVETEVRTASINATGSGYTNGELVHLTTGTGTNATFLVTTNATGYPTSLVIQNKGAYTVNPTLNNSSTASAGSGTGLTIVSEMQVANIGIYEPGSYAIIPSNFANNIPTGGSGAGVILQLSFTQTEKGSFTTQFAANGIVYLTNKENSEQQLAIINSVANDTHMYITTNGFFSCSASYVNYANIVSEGKVLTVPNTTHIRVNDVRLNIPTDILIIGRNSGSKAVANSVSRNDINKNFETFIQLYKYNVDVNSGNFTENEQIFQGLTLQNSFANAFVHSVVNTGGETVIYVSNQIGQFMPSNNLIGANSGAIASINIRYEPELIFGSGEILYIENIEAVSRANNQTEQFKLVFEY